MGSLGSSEQLPDSDSEVDENSQRATLTQPSPTLMKEDSQVDMDDDLLSNRDSLDLSGQSVPHADPEQDVDQDQDILDRGEPPALPDNGPPDDDTGGEKDLCTSLAELNVNQSNNNYPHSPILSLTGHPLSRLCGKNLTLTRNRDREPEFV